ncbi:hypothetical protein MGYG_07596 [Nannizzia gypsea CBS 118893]|uniref:Uncharacterized protein n=1 Tax=Arthroderma gypseum (strain ATCC MYA-4604 / CBS 118893) TaxID=535722 RepID=E4V3L6_ARTGP|nr:hypothetical protein MGYG_07596 [Nannizzia gypsea CBS 118893]EFR04590.1 hypothetical protein MGYG_07596 [Nannizzia gypsea CBS 118893]
MHPQKKLTSTAFDSKLGKSDGAKVALAQRPQHKDICRAPLPSSAQYHISIPNARKSCCLTVVDARRLRAQRLLPGLEEGGRSTSEPRLDERNTYGISNFNVNFTGLDIEAIKGIKGGR